nr:MAG TPA: hypothetical protein [Caudoviricetes sp.]
MSPAKIFSNINFTFWLYKFVMAQIYGFFR